MTLPAQPVPVDALNRAVEPAELVALARAYGAAPHQHHRLLVRYPFLVGENQRLLRDGRRAEISYVLHRGAAAAGVLLHLKSYYPPGAYRLPTGGVHQGETVWQTLVREVQEETGLRVSPRPGPEQAQVERYLGLVSYDFYQAETARSFEFATYHFLLSTTADAEIRIQDETEEIADWQWRPPAALDRAADYLDSLAAHTPDWSSWGQFRALSQRFVAAQLARYLQASPPDCDALQQSQAAADEQLLPR